MRVQGFGVFPFLSYSSTVKTLSAWIAFVAGQQEMAEPRFGIMEEGKNTHSIYRGCENRREPPRREPGWPAALAYTPSIHETAEA